MPNTEQNEPRTSRTAHPLTLDEDQIARLEAGLARLRERDREIFLASSRDRLPYAEIARRHRCSVGKVRRTIAHVLVELHRAVWPHE